MLSLSEMGIIPDEYPNHSLKVKKLCTGDSFIVLHTDKRCTLGAKYEDFENLMVTKIIYDISKKWWQFWKRRKIIGYQITCVQE